VSQPDSEDAQAQVAALREKMLKRSFFVMLRKIPDQSKLPPLLLAHYRWLIDLEQRGVLFASGPTFRSDGSPTAGMTVFRVADFQQADALAASDPFCMSGAASYEVQRWIVGTGRVSVAVNFSDQTAQFE
jgi:uncharacterized protein YciI